MNDPQIKLYQLGTSIPTTRFSAPNQAAFVFKGHYPYPATNTIVVIGMWNPYLSGGAEHFLNDVMDKYGPLQDIHMSVVFESRSTVEFRTALMKEVAENNKLSSWFIVKAQRNPKGKVELQRKDYFTAEAFDIDENGQVKTKINATQTTTATSSSSKAHDKTNEHHSPVGNFLRKMVK